MLANGWQLGPPAGNNRQLALYEEDVIGFVQETQTEQWRKYCKIYPHNPEQTSWNGSHVSLTWLIPTRPTASCALSAPWACCAMNCVIAVPVSNSASSSRSRPQPRRGGCAGSDQANQMKVKDKARKIAPRNDLKVDF